jgi:hypothetical protein
MSRFPLPADLAAIHDDAIAYASTVQNCVAAQGGCQSLSSEALNVLAFSAILYHRSVRTLCEEGWAPTAPVINRTLLDILANCVAVTNQPGIANYMSFKYMSHFHRTWLTDPQITAPEQTEVNAVLNMMANRLEAADQIKAQQLRAHPKPAIYWFRPEYNSVEAIMKLCAVPIYQLYRIYSGPTHGGFAGKFMFDDDPHQEDIEPRAHPKNVSRAVVASTRLLIELCRVRDHWDNGGAGEEVYQELVGRIAALQ